MHSIRGLTRGRLRLAVALAVSTILPTLVLRRAPLDAVLEVLARAGLGLVAAGIATRLVVPCGRSASRSVTHG